MHKTSSFAGLLLTLAMAAQGQTPFAWKDLGDGRMELRERGKPVLVYSYGPQLKTGAPEDRRRCCYVFPLYSPAGVSMLDDFPQDHPHHRGLFWSWPVVDVEGKTYDEWMTMTAKHQAVGMPVLSAQGDAQLHAHNVWDAGGRQLVREDVKLAIHPAQGAARELDVELTLEALGVPVTIRGSREAGKSYGGLSARFAPRERTVLRADGETLSKDEDLTPRRWAELEGVYGGKKVVLRITPDANDPGAPYQWCLRNYGFAGASFPGKTPTSDGYTLEKGKPVTLRFRVRVTDVE